MRKLASSILLGYREKEALYKEACEALRQYDGIIAISPGDKARMLAAGLAEERVFEVDASFDIHVKEPTDWRDDKQYDIMFVAARSMGTERGLEFLLEDILTLVHRSVKVV